MAEKTYNAWKLHQELENAGIQVDGVNSNGVISFNEKAKQKDIDDAETIKSNHDPKISELEAFAHMVSGWEIVLLNSNQWAGLSTAKKNIVQASINKMALSFLDSVSKRVGKEL